MSERRRLCLITGASAGLGAAFARVYAAHGYDLALTARRKDRLETLAGELGGRHDADVMVIPDDLSDAGAPGRILARIAEEGRTVSALVNNAGYGLRGPFHASGWAAEAAMLQVMLTAVTELTHAVLPAMVRDGFGRVINVASLAGLIPSSPGASLYTPIKAFLVRFSQTLHAETHGTGVNVCALCPGFTRTEFHDVTGTRAAVTAATPAMLWMDADAVAARGYAAVEAGRAICITGAPNRAIAALVKLLPDAFVASLIARRYRHGGLPV